MNRSPGQVSVSENYLYFDWVIWYSFQKKQNNVTKKKFYETGLFEVYSLNSVEKFWRAYNNMIPVEYMPSNVDYFFFKANVKPQWEDEANCEGGRWIYDVAWDKNKHSEISEHTESVWLKLVTK